MTWTVDERVGWRVVGGRLHYFDGRASLCELWAQPSTFGEPKKEIFDEIPTSHREHVCARCCNSKAESEVMTVRTKTDPEPEPNPEGGDKPTDGGGDKPTE